MKKIVKQKSFTKNRSRTNSQNNSPQPSATKLPPLNLVKIRHQNLSMLNDGNSTFDLSYDIPTTEVHTMLENLQQEFCSSD